MFIVFEGIDNSGKSTLSKKFVDYLNGPGAPKIQDFYEDPDDAFVADYEPFKWTKEPQFTTEEADRLNSPEFKDEHRREAFFFADRLKHQEVIEEGFVVCDRYAWTGVAYAKKFSPNCYPFVKHVYTDDSILIQPDLYIFVDTPVDICDKRDTSVGKDRLESIRQAYLDTQEEATKSSDVIVTSAEGDAESSLKLLVEKFEAWLGEKIAKNI
jgi:thymidylate kinase